MDKSENLILDIESLTLPPNKCPGSPKMTKALSRKSSCRMERRSVEEQEGDDSSKKLVVKVLCSQMEQLKQPFVPNKPSSAMSVMANSTNLADAGDGKIKRFKRFTAINPRRILLLFASMSSMGCMILIYFTLAIYRRDATLLGLLAVFFTIIYLILCHY